MLIVKKLHKWLSLLVGLQLMIWLITGLYFNLMDHSKATGNTHRINTAVTAKLAEFTLFPINKLTALPLVEMNIVWIENQPFYLLHETKKAHQYQQQNWLLYDAVTGQPFTLSQERVLEIAKRSYKGIFEVASIDLLSPPIAELPKQENNVWQISILDAANTTIYVNAVSGNVIAHINDDRRLRDFMFKLHFMDYANTGSFNHMLIIIFALLTVILSFTGLVWLIQLIKSGSYNIGLFSKYKMLEVVQLDTEESVQHRLLNNRNLLDSLAGIGIELPSNCGGAGSCGCCKFIAEKNTPLSVAEQKNLTAHEKSDGVRLACQQQVKNLNSIKLPKNV